MLLDSSKNSNREMKIIKKINEGIAISPSKHKDRMSEAMRQSDREEGRDRGTD